MQTLTDSMKNSRKDTTDDAYERFREIEYSDTHGTVTIIQDTENERAWIQSDVTLEVRP